MVLPLSLIRTSQNSQILVELKTGDTFSGTLVNSDNWMNMELSDAVLTSKDGDRFRRLGQVFVRGNNVKYVRVPDHVIDIVKDQVLRAAAGSRGGARPANSRQYH